MIMSVRGLLVLCCVGLTVGCSTQLTVAVLGDPDMNRGGNAAVVKVYQLRADGAFQGTPLSSFWQGDAEALGSELVAPPRRLTVYPSASKTLTLEVADEATFLGVAANLRAPDRGHWRAVRRLDGMGDRVSVLVEQSRIVVRAEEGRLPDVGIDVGR
jgi:type VI secretion system VasD/TssJ family lipoprotein